MCLIARVYCAVNRSMAVSSRVQIEAESACLIGLPSSDVKLSERRKCQKLGKIWKEKYLEDEKMKLTHDRHTLSVC